MAFVLNQPVLYTERRRAPVRRAAIRQVNADGTYLVKPANGPVKRAEAWQLAALADAASIEAGQPGDPA